MSASSRSPSTPRYQHRAHDRAPLDALHDPRSTENHHPTDTGNGGMTHAFFKAPKTVDDLIVGRDAIAEWARMTYGWMGRSPDYKAAFLATLGANSNFYDPYQDNARRWYKFSQERVPFINHAIIHPPVDRDRPPNEVSDVCCHVEKETDAGIIVSGARWWRRVGRDQLHLCRAPRPDPAAGQEFRRRLHAADGDSPGVKFICRTSYEMTSTVMGSPLTIRCRRGSDETTPCSSWTRCWSPGRTFRLWRHREGQQLLPAHRLPAALRGAWLHGLQ